MTDRCPPPCLTEPNFQDPISPPPKPTTKSAAPTSAEDLELEKRRARAARFGIPLVESKQSRSTDEKSKKQLPEVCIALTELLTKHSRCAAGTDEAEDKGRALRHRDSSGKQQTDQEEARSTRRACRP